jgi:hypothetical protein
MGQVAKIRKASGAKPRSSPVKSADGLDLSDKEIQAMLPVGLGKMFVGSRLERAKEELAEVGLSAPDLYEGEMPELPNDIASTDHGELSNLLAQFQNAHSTARWQQSLWYIVADAFEEIADYLENVALNDSEQSNDTKRKAEARTDDRVVFFRSRQKEAYHRYVRHRDLADVLKGKVAVVSRVGGFMGEDHDASDVSALKGSTRGSAKGASAGKAARPRIRRNG